MTLIKTVKMPRKLKVAFSNSPANRTHATFRDLGFVAREDGTFDVYSAGGLGNNAKMGVLVAEGVEGSKILYYIRAMVDLFTTYGNYETEPKPEHVICRTCWEISTQKNFRKNWTQFLPAASIWIFRKKKLRQKMFRQQKTRLAPMQNRWCRCSNACDKIR